MPCGNGDGRRAETVPAVTIVSPGAHLLGLWHEVEQQVAGRAGDRQDRAGLPGRCGERADAELRVAQQHHDRVAVRDRLDLADEALAVDHGLVDGETVARALVDLDRLVPGGWRAAVDTRRLRLVRVQPAAARVVDDVAQLRILVRCHLQSCDLGAQPVALGLELVALVLGVERVAEPAEQVPDRLERTVGALLHRCHDLHRPRLDRLQRAAGGLAEVGSQQHQAAGDQREQDRAPASHLSVIHSGKLQA
jgi:hypothetical protein